MAGIESVSTQAIKGAKIGDITTEVAHQLASVLELAVVISVKGAHTPHPEMAGPALAVQSSATELAGSGGEQAKVIEASRQMAQSTRTILEVAKSIEKKHPAVAGLIPPVAPATNGVAGAAKAAVSKEAGFEVLLFDACTNLFSAIRGVLNETAAKRAELSDETRADILSGSRDALTATSKFFQHAGQAAHAKKDTTALQTSKQEVLSRLQFILDQLEFAKPGAVAAMAALEKIRVARDKLSNEQLNGSLPASGQPIRPAIELVQGLAHEIQKLAAGVSGAGAAEALVELADAFPDFVTGVIEASRTTIGDSRAAHLDSAGKVAESLFALAQETRELLAHPGRPEFTAQAKSTAKVLESYVADLDHRFAVAKKLEELAARVIKETKKTAATPGTTYSDGREKVEAAAKSLATALQQVGGNEAVQEAEAIYKATIGLISPVQESAGASEAQGAELLRKFAELGAEVGALFQSGAELTLEPKSSELHQANSSQLHKVSTATAELLSSLRDGAIGDLKREEAMRAAGNVATELETFAVFATNSALEPPRDGVHLKEMIVALSGDLKSLSVAKSQLDIGAAADSLTKNLQKFGAGVRDAAGSVPHASQVAILEAGKHAATDLKKAIGTGQSADLATAVKSMEHLLKLYADEAKRVAEAANQFQEIVEALKVQGKAQEQPTPDMKADKLVASTRPIAAAAAGLTTAIGEGDIKKALEIGRSLPKALAGLQQCINGGMSVVDDLATGRALREAVSSVADALIEFSIGTKKSFASEPGANMPEKSSALRKALGEVLKVSAKLPGGKEVEEDNQEDLEELTERELLAAAKAIEAAARTLASQSADKGAEVTGAVLEAARAITMATGKVVKAAAVGQSQRRVSAKQQGLSWKGDPEWSASMIANAKDLAGKTQNLIVQSNRAAATNDLEGDGLVDSAVDVAAATKMLVLTAKVKNDNTKEFKNLEAASQIVSDATDAFVRSVKDANQAKRDAILREQEMSLANVFKIGDIDQMMVILRLEKELEKARKRQTDRQSQKTGYQGV